MQLVLTVSSYLIIKISWQINLYTDQCWSELERSLNVLFLSTRLIPMHGLLLLY